MRYGEKFTFDLELFVEKDKSLSPVIFLYIFVKISDIHDVIFVVLFLLPLCSTDLQKSVFSPDHCSFTVSLEIGVFTSSNSVLSQTVFTILPEHSQIFRVTLLIFTTNSDRLLTGNVINSWINLGEN